MKNKKKKKKKKNKKNFKKKKKKKKKNPPPGGGKKNTGLRGSDLNTAHRGNPPPFPPRTSAPSGSPCSQRRGETASGPCRRDRNGAAHDRFSTNRPPCSNLRNKRRIMEILSALPQQNHSRDPRALICSPILTGCSSSIMVALQLMAAPQPAISHYQTLMGA